MCRVNHKCVHWPVQKKVQNLVGKADSSAMLFYI